LARIEETRDRRKFLKEERKAIYPELTIKQFQDWVDGENPPYALLQYALVDDSQEIIGGAVVEVHDHLDEKRVLLVLDAIWVKSGWRRKGLGRQLLQETFEEARRYYQKHGLNPVGIMIQTTSLDEGAAEFYHQSINPPYSVTEQEMDGVKIVVFLVPLK